MDFSQAASRCICRNCPSYFDCGEPLAFCLYEQGASGCITIERGCVCPACPVQAANQFGHVFYCTQGNEKALLAGAKG